MFGVDNVEDYYVTQPWDMDGDGNPDSDGDGIPEGTISRIWNFNFDLISFQKFLGDDEELKVPEDYKKVRKI